MGKMLFWVVGEEPNKPINLVGGVRKDKMAKIETMRRRRESKRMLEISLYDKERTIEAGTGIVNPWVALCWKEDLCPNRALLLSLFAEKKSATPYRRVGVKYGDIYG